MTLGNFSTVLHLFGPEEIAAVGFENAVGLSFAVRVSGEIPK